MTHTPRVSVICVTYNHERFIAQSVGSALAQEASFALEIVVAEDHSTDATRQICRELRLRHPGSIRLIESEVNLGPHGNFIEALGAADGEYLAILDGDDYWTDARKLQRQVDFMDGHPDCSICFHSVVEQDEGAVSDPVLLRAAAEDRFYTIRDLMNGNFIPSCSVMLRRGLVKRLPDWYLDMPQGDWPLYILNAQHGWIGYIDEAMAVHRIHAGSAWSGRRVSGELARILAGYEVLISNFDASYRSALRAGQARHRRKLFDALMAEKRFPAAAVCLARYARTPSSCRGSVRPLLKRLVVGMLPAGHRVYRMLRGNAAKATGQ